MCGIVGYIGNKNAVEILIDGLQRLEYRGYDSAGIAVFNGVDVAVRRKKGKIVQLRNALSQEPVSGKIGIAHTRWATHGKPSEENAHPHQVGTITVVHNGIIENHIDLKNKLIADGAVFKSETDTEIFAHLINKYYKSGLSFIDSVYKSLEKVNGSYAITVLNEKEPEKLIGARKGSPLVFGVGKEENFLASDITAILSYTRDMIFLEDGDLVVLTNEDYTIYDMTKSKVERKIKKISWDPSMAEKSGYKHFMQKEIFEQPRAITDTLTGRIFPETGSIFFEDLKIEDDDVKKITNITIVACGTSWHSGLIGKLFLEKYLKIPVEIGIGSEYRYRDPIITDNHLIIGISQSGETADTIAGMAEAKEKGARILSICNVIDSSIARMSDDIIYTHAGPEIGVASTKAFTTQIISLYLLTLLLASKKGTITKEELTNKIQKLSQLPNLIKNILALDKQIKKIAQKYHKYTNFLYLGRKYNYPIALEGALKLKEISYIHAEGYPAGEMKHGPIALIDESMPVVSIATNSSVYEKMYSNIEEVKTRNGLIIALATKGDEKIKKITDDIIFVDSVDEDIDPIINVIPLQMLAYHIAVIRGTDVDQPRNLAKSVTVE